MLEGWLSTAYDETRDRQLALWTNWEVYVELAIIHACSAGRIDSLIEPKSGEQRYAA